MSTPFTQTIGAASPSERLLRLALLGLALMLASTGQPANAQSAYIPPQLEPWVDWVLHDHPNLDCPRDVVSGKAGQCTWVSSLSLDVGTGARFLMQARVFTTTQLPLPGGANQWPTEVKVNGEAARVLGGGRTPAVLLTPGAYQITGEFDWSKRPNALSLPPQTGLINLVLDGKDVARPARNGNSLVLGKSIAAKTASQRDTLSVDVYRLLTDGYPLEMDTTLVLNVSGQSRLVELGRVLLDGFEMTQFQSALPARLNRGGNLEIQVEPGTHQVVVQSRALTSPTTLTPERNGKSWPEQEIWGFLPDRNLRLVQLSGANSIDLSQTAAPFKQDEVRGYVLSADNTLTLTTEQRGNPNPPPNRFQIQRDLWLAFDGSGYVVRDQIGATINHSSRLSATYPLGRISVNGNDELINSLQGSEPGIELQAGSYQINATSELSLDQIASATGWRTNADALQATLNLPPGWRLLWTSGIDRSPDDWLSRWSLWKIFVLVLLAVLAWRFLSKGFAVLVSITTALMMHAAPSLAVMWLIAVVLLASIRHLEHQGAQKLLTLVGSAWLALAGLIAVGEAVTHARQAIYPQLEHHSALAGVAYSRVAPPADMVEMDQLKEDSAVAMSSAEGMATATTRKMRGKNRPAVTQTNKKYVNGLQVQTGPGQPQWAWNTARLIWDGPVSEQQTISLTLASPLLNRVINLLIAFLLITVSALLITPLLGAGLRQHLPSVLRGVTPAIISVVLLAPAPEANAADTQTPPVTAELLEQLEQRLTEIPKCFPNCANVQRAAIEMSDSGLNLVLTVHAESLVAMPVPTSGVWNPRSATLNGKPATLSRTTNNALQIALPPGRHTLELRGPTKHLERFELAFPMTPAAISTDTGTNWRVGGIANGRIVRGSLSFERKTQTSANDQTLKQIPAKPFVEILRTLRFDQEWFMDTVVRRKAPSSGSFTVSVPLILDEAVLNSEINIVDNTARLVFSRRDNQIRWRSRLTPTTQLQLTAPDASTSVTRWTLVPSNFWHVEFDGLNPVGNSAERGGPTFHPEASETLTLELTKTSPVPGETVTVEQVSHQITVGARQQSHQLLIDTLASEGGTLNVKLGSETTDRASPITELVSVVVNGREEPISLIEDAVLPLPLAPGSARYEINWLENTPRSALFRVAETSLGRTASNVTTNVNMSRDRWVLFLGGPALGPGILYWGMLLVVLFLALVIARIPGLPFTATDAILLSLGLSLANLPATLLIGIWVIALRYRHNLINNLRQSWTRNTLQLATAALSVITVLTLIFSVPNALLGSPNMQVSGNNSSAYNFNWFSDRTLDALPSAWVLSVPLWVYRVIMLIWSLWLAFALIRWVPWAWRQWATPEMWYSNPPISDGLSGRAATPNNTASTKTPEDQINDEQKPPEKR